MKINEITINIPIQIDLTDKESPNIKMNGNNINSKLKSKDNVEDNPIMLSPLQQDLELRKAKQGKRSPAIDKILDDEDIGSEDTDSKNIKNIRTLAGLS